MSRVDVRSESLVVESDDFFPSNDRRARLSRLEFSSADCAVPAQMSAKRYEPSRYVFVGSLTPPCLGKLILSVLTTLRKHKHYYPILLRKAGNNLYLDSALINHAVLECPVEAGQESEDDIFLRF